MSWKLIYVHKIHPERRWDNPKQLKRLGNLTDVRSLRNCPSTVLDLKKKRHRNFKKQCFKIYASQKSSGNAWYQKLFLKKNFLLSSWFTVAFLPTNYVIPIDNRKVGRGAFPQVIEWSGAEVRFGTPQSKHENPLSVSTVKKKKKPKICFNFPENLPNMLHQIASKSPQYSKIWRGTLPLDLSPPKDGGPKQSCWADWRLLNKILYHRKEIHFDSYIILF